jgi:hypothetical protein
MRAFLLVLVALLGACASPYGAAGITGGYQDRMVREDLWVVAYYANAYTTEETVQTYWLHHASTLTLAHGYQGFAILDEPHLSSLAPGGARIEPAVESGGITGKPFMVARIQMLHAPFEIVPGRIFDARALKAFLDPYVTGPLCGSNVCPHIHRYLLPGFGSGAAQSPT